MSRQSSIPFTVSLPTLDALEARRLFASISYTEQDLVSNQPGHAAKTDARLQNPWGEAVGPKGIEVANNGTGKGTMYNGNGENVVATVTIPGHGGAQGTPTGVAINTSTADFIIPAVQKSAQFIYVEEDGTVAAWSGQKADASATVVLDNSASGAIYKGLAIGTFKHQAMIYAADFGKKRIDVINTSFRNSHVTKSFTDPNLPTNYAPFDVANINGQLWVTYAKSGGGVDEVDGKGLGLVDIFNMDGSFDKRFTTGGTLNAPWGITMAPSNFGKFSGNILVGNFGDGKITAFKSSTGQRRGQLSNLSGQPLVIDGLWGLEFGNGKAGNLTTGLYFAGGTNDEADGLYGRLIADPDYSPQSISPTHLFAQQTIEHRQTIEDLDGSIASAAL